MSVLLDTNILSEVLRPRPSPAVIGRLLQFTSQTLFASEVTRFEMRFGARGGLRVGPVAPSIR